MFSKKLSFLWVATLFAIFAFLVVPDASGQGDSDAQRGTSTPTSATLEGPADDGFTPPTACFTKNPSSGQAPLYVSFNSSCSSASAVYFDWQFGDGGSSQSPNPSHTYNSAGTYSANLTVCSNTGQCDSTSQTVTVNPPPPPPSPTACFTKNPSSGPAPLYVSFSSSCSSASAVYFDWQFGDGGASQSPNPSHTYNTPGSYTVTLTVCSSNGQCDGTSQTVTVNQPPPPTNTPPPPSPTACFTKNPSSGPAPLYVSFSSSCSSASAVYFDWQFGDGGESQSPNTSHTYNTPGSYTVTLTVCSSNGQCDDTSQTVTVNNSPTPTNTSVPPTPTACFTKNPSSGPAPLFVSFSSSCSSASAVYFDWQFGDGGESQSPNPSHTYNTPGSYTATLTVCSNNGQCDGTSQTVTVNVPPTPTNTPPPPAPTACFVAMPTSGIAPLHVSFSSSCSSSSAVLFFWEFGDGGESDVPNPSHTYQNIGTYIAKLTVCSQNNQCSSKTRTITVHDTPTACFTPNTISGYTPLTVNFNSSCSSSNVVSYQWNFDDGATSTAANPSHTYQSAGVYQPTLIVCSQSNICRTTSGTVVVTDPPVPTACFTAAPTSGYAPLTVYVNSSCSTASAVYYFWDFGNGATSESPNAYVTYDNAGTFTITLTVCNQIYQCDDATRTITAWELPPPTASFTFSPTNPEYGQKVTFTNTSTPPVHLTSCLWDFGDGTTVIETCDESGKPDFVVDHTFPTVGTYTVTLTITNLSGSNSTSQDINVGAPPPVAIICAYPQNGQWPEDSHITFNASECSSGLITEYAWDFGDGNASTLANPVHDYAEGGDYTVTLTVTGPGGTDEDSIVIELKHPDPPVVEVFEPSYEGQYPYVGAEIDFSGTVSGYFEQWEWDFGDGTDPLPGDTLPAQGSHTYSEPGPYTVTLTAEHYHDSDSDSVALEVVILPPPQPVIDYNIILPDEPGPFTIEFDDNSQSDAVVDWLWEFGDGGVGYGKRVTHVYDLPIPPAGLTVRLTTTNILGDTGEDTEIITFTAGELHLYQCTESLTFYIRVGGVPIEVDLEALNEALVAVGAPPLIPFPYHEIRALIFVNDVYGFPQTVDTESWTNSLSGGSLYFEPGNQTPTAHQYHWISPTSFAAGGQLEWVANLEIDADITLKLDPEVATIKIGEITITGGVPLSVQLRGQSSCFGNYPGKWVELNMNSLTEDEIAELLEALSPEDQAILLSQLEQ